MTIDKKVDCIKLAKAVVRQTRNDVLISKTQMTDCRPLQSKSDNCQQGS